MLAGNDLVSSSDISFCILRCMISLSKLVTLGVLFVVFFPVFFSLFYVIRRNMSVRVHFVGSFGIVSADSRGKPT